MNEPPDFAQLKEILIPILKKHGVEKASLFGSRTRGEASNGSDLDLLIRFSKNTREKMFRLLDIEEEIRELTAIRADITTFQGLNPRLKASIDQDLIPLL
ncbi:DNA polymerase subunit beta [bacterium]|jgi:uncharacterized protein|nr:DNA polymerase subunit beta [bacterium]